MKDDLIISIRMTVILAVITCGVYPLAIYGIGQLAFRDKANGSLIEHNGRIVGSALIGQPFESERYFHSRPGAYDGTNSGGTNLGPTSKKLADSVAAAIQSYDIHTNVPADAVTGSASGLDPHISPENAYAQAPRVAREHGMSVEAVRALIDRHTEGRFLGVYGEPRVNVLLLNLELSGKR